MNKTFFIAVIAALFLTGCEKDAEQNATSFYNQKNGTVFSYEQTEQKLAYEECLARHRDSHTEGECHVPDFLKK